MATYNELKTELVTILDLHIDLLKEAELIESENLDGVLFMMRSFGFILDRAPGVLAEDDEEEMNFMMFQYYCLLKELKYNLGMSFPYATLQGRGLIEVAEEFPTTYEQDMREWWESRTGLVVEETKQTIENPEFEM